MKIGIYARGLSRTQGGVKEFIYLMTSSLIDQLEDQDELYIFHNVLHTNEPIFPTHKKNVHEIILQSKRRLYCDFFLGPQLIRKLDLDVVWFPKNVIPFFITSKNSKLLSQLLINSQNSTWSAGKAGIFCWSVNISTDLAS